MELAPFARRDPWRWEKLAFARGMLLVLFEIALVVYWWDWTVDDRGFALLLGAIAVIVGSAYVGAIEAALMLAYALRPAWRPRADTRGRREHVKASALRIACGLLPIAVLFADAGARRWLSDRSFLARHRDELDALVADGASSSASFPRIVRDGPRTLVSVGTTGLGDVLYFIHDPTSSLAEQRVDAPKSGAHFHDPTTAVHVAGPWYSWVD